MINIITGTPGAGKTYLAIKLLVEKHFFWHKKDKGFYRKEDSKKYTIFTNIDGFNLPHKNLIEIFNEQNLTFETFFTVSYQERLHKKYKHIIYIIDECQQFIPYTFKNKDVVYYFDYHRHFGDSVWLVTQDYSKISRSINVLAELEYRAVKSTFTILGEFRYNIKSNGQIFKRKTAKKDKRIFSLYKSFSGDDQEKHSNPLKYIIFILFAAFIGLGFFFYDMITPSAERQAVIKQPNKNIITSFKNENEINPKKSESKSLLDPDQLRSIPIKSFVEKNDNLYAFECPITGKWLYISEIQYHVQKINHSYYVILSNHQYLQLLAQDSFYSQSQS